VAALSSPVLVLAGEADANTVPLIAAEFAGLFPGAKLVVQPGAGHYPWLDEGVPARKISDPRLVLRRKCRRPVLRSGTVLRIWVSQPC
jgi:pimeloyl-ACP methyl ester carboxylesterase